MVLWQRGKRRGNTLYITMLMMIMLIMEMMMMMIMTMVMMMKIVSTAWLVCFEFSSCMRACWLID